MLLDYARSAAFHLIMTVLVGGAAFTALCGAYAAKSALGIDVLEGHFFLHPLFYP